MQTITALQAIKGLNALREIEGQPLPFGTALKIYKAVRELQPVSDAYAKAEEKIVAECAKKRADGKPDIVEGRFIVEPGKTESYAKKRAELDGEPVEWKRRKLEDLEGASITAAALGDLMELFDI